MSCAVFVQKGAAGDQPSGCVPCPPVPPLQSLLTFGLNIFPSNDSHKYVDLPDNVSSALCGCGSVVLHVWGGQWTCVFVCVPLYEQVVSKECYDPSHFFGHQHS